MADVDVVEVDYSTMSKDTLLAELGKAWEEKPEGYLKLMSKLSTLVAKAEATELKEAKDALLAALIAVTQDTLKEFTTLADKLVDSGKLDGAEGIWFAMDFGEKREKGINPALRLVKGRKAAGTGESSGKSSYVANPAKSADLLAQVGSHVYFMEDTTVTIDKAEQVVPAGTTYKVAYDLSTNGGWRNRVRMALLKEAGII